MDTNALRAPQNYPEVPTSLELRYPEAVPPCPEGPGPTPMGQVTIEKKNISPTRGPNSEADTRASATTALPPPPSLNHRRWHKSQPETPRHCRAAPLQQHASNATALSGPLDSSGVPNTPLKTVLDFAGLITCLAQRSDAITGCLNAALSLLPVVTVTMTVICWHRAHLVTERTPLFLSSCGARQRQQNPSPRFNPGSDLNLNLNCNLKLNTLTSTTFELNISIHIAPIHSPAGLSTINHHQAHSNLFREYRSPKTNILRSHSQELTYVGHT